MSGLAADAKRVPVIVEDDLAPRVRLPADALRCVVECVEIALLVALGLLARATVSGVETNVVGASQLTGNCSPGCWGCSATWRISPC